MNNQNEINIKNLFEKNKNLLKDKVILDIGSNVGDFSKKIIENTSYKHIHLFEPVKKYFEKSKEILGKNVNLSFHNIALGSIDEVKKIYICKQGNDGWNTLLDVDPYQYDNFYEHMDNEYVSVKKLDNYLSDIDQIDFIKIDVEGFEAEVLEGSFELIKKFKPYILIEMGWGNKHPNWNKNANIYKKLFDLGYEEQDLNFSETMDVLFVPKSIKKLPISIGILSWNSTKSLMNSLDSYKKNGLFEICDDITIFFQEANNNDLKIASDYKIDYLCSNSNIGIGKAFEILATKAKNEFILLLEHDWELIENPTVSYKMLLDGLNLLGNGYNCIRYRHRTDYGDPLYSRSVYEGNELNFLDKCTQLVSPHLLDCIHWIKNPNEKFPDYIIKIDSFYGSKSRWANWTNNPCLYKKDFYIKCVNNFTGAGIELEANISKWWAEQDFMVAQGEGLFKHNDIDKYKKYNIVDVFPYFNEDELLELRIKLLNNYVDKFIICEANRTHTGAIKEYTCKKRLKELNLLSDKVQVIEVDLSKYKKEDNWGREREQRNAAAKFIDNNDVCFISDLDEIINPEFIKYYSELAIHNIEYIIRVPMVILCSRADLAECKNSGELEKTNCAFFCLRNHLENYTISEIREFDSFKTSSKFSNTFVLDNNVLENSGWHFSWMGDACRRKIKYKSFAHYYDKDNPESVLPPNILDEFSSKDPQTRQFLLSEWLGRMLPFGEKTEDYISSYIPKEGGFDALGRKKILKKYPIEFLPKEIFNNKKIKNFLLPD